MGNCVDKPMTDLHAISSKDGWKKLQKKFIENQIKRPIEKHIMKERLAYQSKMDNMKNKSKLKQQQQMDMNRMRLSASMQQSSPMQQPPSSPRPITIKPVTTTTKTPTSNVFRAKGNQSKKTNPDVNAAATAPGLAAPNMYFMLFQYKHNISSNKRNRVKQCAAKLLLTQKLIRNTDVSEMQRGLPYTEMIQIEEEAKQVREYRSKLSKNLMSLHETSNSKRKREISAEPDNRMDKFQSPSKGFKLRRSNRIAPAPSSIRMIHPN